MWHWFNNFRKGMWDKSDCTLGYLLEFTKRCWEMWRVTVLINAHPAIPVRWYKWHIYQSHTRGSTLTFVGSYNFLMVPKALFSSRPGTLPSRASEKWMLFSLCHIESWKAEESPGQIQILLPSLEVRLWWASGFPCTCHLGVLGENDVLPPTLKHW